MRAVSSDDIGSLAARARLTVRHSSCKMDQEHVGRAFGPGSERRMSAMRSWVDVGRSAWVAERWGAWIRARVVFLLLAGSASLPAPVRAAVFHVSCARDGAAALVEAIREANINGEADVIRLTAGSCLLVEPEDFQDGFNGLPTITSEIHIVGEGASKTSIERAVGAVGFRLIHVSEEGKLRLKGVSVRNGLVDFPIDLSRAEGGGIFSLGHARLEGVHVIDNMAFEAGGGVANRGYMEISNSLVSGNEAIDLSGGGILSIGVLWVTSTTVSDNHADSSGGIGSAGLLYVTDSLVSGNDAFIGAGGIEKLGIEGTAWILRSTVSDNSTFFGGGGIENRGQGRVFLSESTVSGNWSDLDGGISNSGTSFHVSNSTVSGNYGGSFAGGIDNLGGMTITNSTIVENATATGEAGNIRSFGAAADLTLKNSIVANAVAGSDCAGDITSAGGNIDEDGSCGLDPELGDLPETDPMLGGLANNGGPTDTHLPRAGSPAINAIALDACRDAKGVRLLVDQRGVRRPQGGACDIGSVEVAVSTRSLISRIGALPDAAFRRPPLRNLLVRLLVSTDRLLQRGLEEKAAQLLKRTILRRVDGCDASPAAMADGDDWIVACPDQRDVRGWIEELLAQFR